MRISNEYEYECSCYSNGRYVVRRIHGDQASTLIDRTADEPCVEAAERAARAFVSGDKARRANIAQPSAIFTIPA